MTALLAILLAVASPSPTPTSGSVLCTNYECHAWTPPTPKPTPTPPTMKCLDDGFDYDLGPPVPCEDVPTPKPSPKP